MICKAEFEDIDRILEVTKACASYMINKGIYQWNANYPNKTVLKNDVLKGELFVIKKNKIVVGCIVVSYFMDKEYKAVSWLTENNRNIYIHRLAIHPKYQGQGYAQKLMDFAENFAKNNNCASIRLDTFSQNQRNQKFYELRGYKKLGNIFFPKQSHHPFYCYELIL
ncbi:GNAT family N-acetyltransferase [Gelatiniphilus marinus]|uniref:GNAT family N-acetyltransferase n=1 Tax=Gelatiniphilus marinus TaxID=1759464 RepID=A0ABW5JU65_9FLAO